MSGDDDTRRLAAPALENGDPIGWFEQLYAEAQYGTAVVPWDRGAPNAMLVDWATSTGLTGTGQRAMVVGCGPGRDSEYLASLGFETTAFDVAPTAIETARTRHPATVVQYEVADLLALPAGWRARFDLVLESHNVQALPPPLHGAAAAAVASLVAPGGTLLVLAAAGDGAADGPLWPLTRAEVEGFAVDGVRLVAADAVPGDVVRWRAVLDRPV